MVKWWVLGLSLVAGVAWAESSADPLAELAALGSSMTAVGPEGGGSIRAKREVDLTKTTRQTDAENLEARVEEVKVGRFPAAAVRLRVVKPAKSWAGAELKANDTLVIVPALKVENGRIIMDDPNTTMNAGSYYLQTGDKVMLKLTKKQGAMWQAGYIERK